MKTNDKKCMIQVIITFQNLNTNKEISISREITIEKVYSPVKEWIAFENKRYEGKKWEVIETIVHEADVIKVVMFELKCCFTYDPDNLSVNSTLELCRNGSDNA